MIYETMETSLGIHAVTLVNLIHTFYSKMFVNPYHYSLSNLSVFYFTYSSQLCSPFLSLSLPAS